MQMLQGLLAKNRGDKAHKNLKKGLHFFVKEEKKMLYRKELKQKIAMEKEKEKDEKIQEVDEEGNPIIPTLDVKSNKKLFRTYFNPPWMSEARVDKTEYIGPKRPRHNEDMEEEKKDNNEDQVSMSEETDEEFDWYNAKMDDETHFVLVNNNRDDFEPGDQVYYCYGNRPNKYLLINYGFCFKGNRYESVHINLKLDCELDDPFVPNMVDVNDTSNM